MVHGDAAVAAYSIIIIEVITVIETKEPLLSFDNWMYDSPALLLYGA